MSDSVAGQISADATSHVDFLTLGLQKCTLFFLHCNCSTGAQLHVKVFGIAIAVLLLSCMSIRFCYALIGIAFSHVVLFLIAHVCTSTNGNICESTYAHATQTQAHAQMQM